MFREEQFRSSVMLRQIQKNFPNKYESYSVWRNTDLDQPITSKTTKIVQYGF